MPQNFEKPVVGYNHNVKHRGRLFHIQTEDSGVKNPHVITHVFVGGNIIATKKISYADILDAENLPDAVRQLMEMQHKEILRNLINGVYDDLDLATTAPYYQPGEITPRLLHLLDRPSPHFAAALNLLARQPCSSRSPPKPRPRRTRQFLPRRRRARSTHFSGRT